MQRANPNPGPPDEHPAKTADASIPLAAGYDPAVDAMVPPVAPSPSPTSTAVDVTPDPRVPAVAEPVPSVAPPPANPVANSAVIPTGPADVPPPPAAPGVVVGEGSHRAELEREWGDWLTPYRGDEDVMTGLTLVYTKQPPQLMDVEKDVRVGLLRAVLSGDGAKGKNAGRRERLLRLVTSPSDKGAASPPPSVQGSIDGFYAAIPAWASPLTSTVFFRDCIPGSVVYRKQLAGNCFGHAAIVAAHYVICKNNPAGALTEMLDLTAYVLKSFHGEKLWKYVYDDEGALSKYFLQEIAGLNEAELFDVTAKAIEAPAIVERLETYGPALVMQFAVFGGFGGVSHSHIGPDTRASCGQHAMVIVGWRTGTDGTSVFLVQNWYEEKQFFECDIEFLRSRGASCVDHQGAE